MEASDGKNNETASKKRNYKWPIFTTCVILCVVFVVATLLVAMNFNERGKKEPNITNITDDEFKTMFVEKHIVTYNATKLDLTSNNRITKRNLLVIPGTKWCGQGDVATSYSDLGFFHRTDKCCRDHDSCPYSINANESKYGLVNTLFFTVSQCDCEDKFYLCLKKLNTWTSNLVGYGYFTVLAPKCFRKEYPVVGCKEYIKTNYTGKCLTYEFDKTKEKKYQWFESHTYDGSW